MKYEFSNFEGMLRAINTFFYAEFGKKGHITLLLDEDYYDSRKMFDLISDLTLHASQNCPFIDFASTVKYNFNVGTMTISSYRNMETKIIECIRHELQQVITGAK